MTAAGWRVSEDVVWAGEDTVRLYHVATGEFRSLNRTGSAIWCLMATGADSGQITDELAQKMGGGEPAAYAMIAGDVESFLSELAAQHIVVATMEGKADGRGRPGRGPDEVVSQG
jgi:hypothetical protein